MAKELKFPDNFLWGASTSSYQIEGDIINDWSEWEKSEKRTKKLKEQNLNPDNFVCGSACDSWNKLDDDLQCIKELNLNTYRFSLEWARIEPKSGQFNQEAIEKYKNFLIKLKQENIKTILTLWHWTNPLWVSQNGGWENKNIIQHFSIYTQKIIDELGDYVDYWVVLNEPLIHVFNGYLGAKFPPQKKSLFKAGRVFNNLAQAHTSAYKLIHEKYPQAMVGISEISNYFEPAHRYCLLERATVKLLNYFWNLRFLNKIKNHMDYVGMSYYFHDRLSIIPPFRRNENKKITDVGWEIYPSGIYHISKMYWQKYKKPILITENGLADAQDKYRSEFIKEHLKHIHQAIEEEINIIGYCHWSLLDNFEWALGWAPKFGLFEVDKNTFVRKARPSAKYYAEICKNNSLKI